MRKAGHSEALHTGAGPGTQQSWQPPCWKRRRRSCRAVNVRPCLQAHRGILRRVRWIGTSAASVRNDRLPLLGVFGWDIAPTIHNAEKKEPLAVKVSSLRPKRRRERSSYLTTRLRRMTPLLGAQHEQRGGSYRYPQSAASRAPRHGRMAVAASTINGQLGHIRRLANQDRPLHASQGRAAAQ